MEEGDRSQQVIVTDSEARNPNGHRNTQGPEGKSLKIEPNSMKCISIARIYSEINKAETSDEKEIRCKFKELSRKTAVC